MVAIASSLRCFFSGLLGGRLPLCSRLHLALADNLSGLRLHLVGEHGEDVGDVLLIEAIAANDASQLLGYCFSSRRRV